MSNDRQKNLNEHGKKVGQQGGSVNTTGMSSQDRNAVDAGVNAGKKGK